MIYRFPQKDPDDILDYYIDLSNVIGIVDTDSIDSVAISISPVTTPALSLVQSGKTLSDDRIAYFVLSGGLADTDYSLDVTVNTVSGRRINGTYKINVVNK